MGDTVLFVGCVQCAVGWIPSGTLIIAFRGTANLTNVKADINFFSKRVSNILWNFSSEYSNRRIALCSLAHALNDLHWNLWVHDLEYLHLSGVPGGAPAGGIPWRQGPQWLPAGASATLLQ
jgi:hypothetical protein